MAVTDKNLAQAWTPEDYGMLVDAVLDAESTAFQAGTVVTTQNESIRFPLLTADPSVGWYPENTQITLSDLTTGEAVVVPQAVKGLTQASNQAVADTTPAVAGQIGRSLARAVAKQIDAAFFDDGSTANSPAGLLAGNYSSIDTGSGPTSLDPFHDAKRMGLAAGAELTSFILSPGLANTLAKLKTASGSNAGLLESVGDGIQLAGVNVLVSNAVAAGEAWGIDRSQVMAVRRTGTQVEMSRDAAFGSDATQVRAVARVGFGICNAPGVIRLHKVV